MRKDSAGLRRKMRSAVDLGQGFYPRRGLNGHKMEWYLDGHLVGRPVNGIFAMTRLSAHMLSRVKFGPEHLRPLLPEATRFHADAVRAADDMLHSGALDRPLSPSDRRRFSARVGALVDAAREMDELIRGYRKEPCPACGGRKLTRADAKLLDAILSEQSANGTIPKHSALYRESVLTPMSAL